MGFSYKKPLKNIRDTVVTIVHNPKHGKIPSAIIPLRITPSELLEETTVEKTD
jgi:hypothetical protein